MADFYTNGDNLFKRNLKEIQENLQKTDIVLVKKEENIFPLSENKGKLFEKLNEREKHETKMSKGSKKQVIYAFSEKLKSLALRRYLNDFYLSSMKVIYSQICKFSQAIVTKSKSVIEKKKSVFFKNVTSESKLRDKKDKERIRKEKDKKDEERGKKDKLKSEKEKKEKNKINYVDDILNIFTPLNNHNTSSHSSISEKLSLNKSKNKINYSWQDINSWLSPLQKEKINDKLAFDLKKTYSWEILGIGTQTSNYNLRDIDSHDYNTKHECTVKYSWQIIGKSTQVSMNDYENNFILNKDYWQGSILSPRKNYQTQKKNLETNYEKLPNKIRVLHCEKTQTSSDKKTETEFTECRIKYSWENLIKQHLKSFKSESIKKSNFDKHLRTRNERMKCPRKYSWENLIDQHLN